MELNFGYTAPPSGTQLELTVLVPAHKMVVLPMVEDFYNSSAVEHPVPKAVLEQTFQDATNPNNPLITGYLIKKGGIPVGFFYLSFSYACEVGGLCILIEEVYIKAAFQGKGLGKEILQWLLQAYPEAKRFRLEVTASNEGAKKLYEKLGFQPLGYEQMVTVQTLPMCLQAIIIYYGKQIINNKQSLFSTFTAKGFFLRL